MFVWRVLLRGGMEAAWMQVAGKVKEMTEIVGPDIVPNARKVLISLYTCTLKDVYAIPEDKGYHNVVKSFTRHRLIVYHEEDWVAIENCLNCGQVEEV
ncbi:hypothetical protein OPV22_005762 [Ensete ventricosum]|uniref:Uncharacterized protein n=1 Tax=Ensete ventricosum TaxID=4639 RepID=A0AAV8RJE4_ENSVE|nr:hypothetical protein OPV22_005762 [Ensete ventricosum]